jgi:hypothetical protein
MRHAGHQHRSEDELDCREGENADSSRNPEEQCVLDNAQDAGDSNRVVLVIVVLALIFIVVMTYFVAQMPQKP